ncbi:ABC transporter permease [Alicyclobacillus fastidiosus]|uniref:ABC transporter permease n=1 Tax=Alicyclobacillus fastidiosus TaxID=392011 RepID=A0ABV5AE35_9BACL|nr:ABC transporter permease [Alicyclobacillus fastidiosus]WEH08525.1 ABC transporter permease [Alicyclobacillus fastidiosus]
MSTNVGAVAHAPSNARGRKFKKSLKRYPLVYIGALIIVIMGLIAILAPWISPHDPIQTFNSGLNEQGIPVGPSKMFPLGADGNGRDVLSRVIWGGRISLLIGLLSMVINLVVGTVLGLIAGVFGGWVDALVMRITDTVLAFPFLLFALALVAILGSSLWNILLTIGILGWGVMARVVRGQVLQVRELEYVQAARALGATEWRIMFRIVLPNVFGPVIVLSTLNVGANILAAAGLSFLGMGIQPPTPDWGGMIQEGLTTYTYAPWELYSAGIALVITVVGFNMLGDGLRDILDPQSMTRQ